MKTQTTFERTTDRRFLRELVNGLGDNAKAHVAIGARVGLSTLEKLMAGTYGRVPKEAMQLRLAHYFGVKRDELFPFLENAKKRTA